MQELIHQEDSLTLVGLSLQPLLSALAILCFISILLGTKIFLTTEIYHTSRNINALQAQYDILIEEKQRLEKELEVVRSHYLITNLDD